MSAADWNDVRFDYDTSLQTARRLWQLADQLDSLGGDRRRWAVEALVDWEGSYGSQFARRIDTEAADLRSIAEQLRAGATGWAQAWAQALNLQNRRLWARACDRTRQQRSNVDKVVGFFTGHDDLPSEPYTRATPTAPNFVPTGTFAIYGANS